MADERNTDNNKTGRKRSNPVATAGDYCGSRGGLGRGKSNLPILHRHRSALNTNSELIARGQNHRAILQAIFSSLGKKIAEKLIETMEMTETLKEMAEQVTTAKTLINDASLPSTSHQDMEFALGLHRPALRLLIRVYINNICIYIHVYSTLLDHPQPSKSEIRQTDTFHLSFVSQMPKKVFTGDRLKVKVELLDSDFKWVAGIDTKMAEIIVIHGDYEPVHKGTDDQLAKFNGKDIVCPRECKGLLISKSCGKLILKIENGVGVIDDLKFVDNSSWTRSKMFKLGARVIESKSKETVGEAVSNAFRVKDGRGRDSQKHDNPNLNDEVWRLKGIGKYGPKYQQLRQNETVKMIDFLRLYNVDPSSLRNLLKVSDKQWEEIIKQATLCPLTDEKYSSTDLNYSAELVYNCIWEIDGVFLDGNYQDFQTLNEHQKVLVRDLRLLAYKNKWISPRCSQAAYDGITSLPNGIGSLTMVASLNPLNPDVGDTGLDSWNTPGLNFATTSSQPMGDPVEGSSIQPIQYHTQQDS